MSPVTFQRRELIVAMLEATKHASRQVMSIVYGESGELSGKNESDRFDYAAQRSEHVISEVLWQHAGSIPLVSETGDDVFLDSTPIVSQPAWLFSPLSGIDQFLSDNGTFTVSIGLVEHSEPKLGVVYAPALERLYLGEVEQGSVVAGVAPDRWPDDEDGDILALIERARLLPTRKTEPGSRVLAVDLTRWEQQGGKYINSLLENGDSVQVVDRAHPLELCLVAEGAADEAAVPDTTKEWESAAADAIVRAAGCRVGLFGEGTPLTYNKPDRTNPPFSVIRKSAPMRDPELAR